MPTPLSLKENNFYIPPFCIQLKSAWQWNEVEEEWQYKRSTSPDKLKAYAECVIIGTDIQTWASYIYMNEVEINETLIDNEELCLITCSEILEVIEKTLE